MLLEMKDVTKYYGNVLANDKVSLYLNQGEILAIVGENGAGKSTIMKILYGLEDATSGEIYLNGQIQNFKNPQDAIAKGIGMVQQHFMLFDRFTVAENIVYGKEPTKNGTFFDKAKAKEIVEELTRKYGLEINPDLLIKDCAVGLQQRTEILKVLYQGADIIIFDEPTAVLTPQEIDGLFDTMRELVAMGKSIIVITHKLQEVMDISDRVVVMRKGQTVADLPKVKTSIEELSMLMVGRDLATMVVEPYEAKDVVLKIEDLTLKGIQDKPILDKINLNVKKHEIVGIAGVSGNGQSEIIDIITGIRQADQGSIQLEGKEILNKSVKEIRDSGCACIPEDRYYSGSAREASLKETVIMAHHLKEDYSKNGILKDKNITDFAIDTIEKYDVRCDNHMQALGELSGGNAQKLIVAREVEQESVFLIAAEPTRGVDIGAIEFIHTKLLEKREKGDAILLVSSELSEITSLSDRIYTIFDGRINGEFTREEATPEKLGLYMMGGSE